MPTQNETGTVKDARGVVVGVAAVVAVILAVFLANPGGQQSPTPVTGVSSVAATGETKTVEVGVDGMAFTPSTIDVQAGDHLQIVFTNTGDQSHDLVLETGPSTGTVAPGASATLDAGVISGDVEGWCSLPGHRQMGMVLHIRAAGGQDGAQSTSSMNMEHDHAATPLMTELQDRAKAEKPADAALPALKDSREHRIEIRVTESTQQVTDTLTRQVWMYNGTAPGPVLHGRVGDTFHVHLVNDGTMGHSIDFHAGEVAPDEPMRTIAPGESLDYTFTAARSGIWMYHCSTMPMSSHIANGMHGAVVIDPDGLERADREYVLIQAEQYLGADGAAADADKIAAGTPDIVAFNGRAFQYDAHPLQAKVGERVRIWVLDAGPDAALAFHVVGTQFDTVWSEGRYTVKDGKSMDGGATQGVTGAQVLPLLAAQGGFVEFTPKEAGSYAMVNHQMSLAEKGAHGILKVTD